MRKLAFENVTSGFEMPSFKVVGLEKENSNIMFAIPKTIYRKGTGFTRSALLAAALSEEEEGLFSGLSGYEPVVE